MKPRDHIHNLSEENPSNIKVFDKTYELIDAIANKVTEIERHAFGIEDEESLLALNKINAMHFSEQIIDTINFAIEYYRKTPKRNAE